jgi:ferredoxin-NADP reductase
MAMKLLMKARIAAVVDETSRIRRFQLVPVTRERFPDVEAGDHVIVLLPNGMRRAYSLCGDPGRSDLWQIAVLKEEAGLGGSRYLHDDVATDDTLFVSWPQPGLTLADAPVEQIFFAGGIGVTPFMSMIPELERRSARFMLHMCARSPDDLPFRAALEGLEKAGKARLWFSGTTGGRVNMPEAVRAAASNAHLYCCGPARMIEAFLEATAARDPANVHVERFAGMTTAEASQGDPFTIRLGQDGPRLDVPATRSMMAVLRDAGVEVDALCEGGACGSCKVGYLAGEPVHRDFCLRTADRAHIVMACVSRAKGELVLDLMAP